MTAQPEWFDKNYYDILGVAEKATSKEITRAYRKLARDLHPDANPGDAAAEEKFKEVSAAYDVVGDDAKRKEYDEVRRLGPMAGGGFRPGGGAGQNMNFSADDLGSFGEMFGNLFNARRGGGASGAGPQRGADLQTELTMDFVDAVAGIDTTLHLTSETSCSVCRGTGSKPDKPPKICVDCHGRGVIDDNQGLFSFSRPCPTCGGRGVIVVDPCSQCRGTGVERRPRDVKVRIPAGVNDGQTIKLKGQGGPGRNGGPPGDLFVKVHVAADPRFGRSGRNLTIAVPVTFPEAALGAKVQVPTLNGSPVTIKVPAGTDSGKVFRVKGRGIETKKGKGDLLVTVEVSVPKKLSKAQKAAIDALVAASSDDPRADLGV